MLKSFGLLTVSVIIFFAVMLTYGNLLRCKETPLREVLEKKKIERIENPKIIVETENNTLKFFDGKNLIKKYNVDLGHSDFNLVKVRKNYCTTPKGIFSICKETNSEKFYKKFQLSYPDSFYIYEAEKLSLISKKKASTMLKNLRYGCSISFDKKIFGPKIYIHGFGKANFILKNLPFIFNWTNGSIALSNEDLDELSPYLNIGMKIIII